MNATANMNANLPDPETSLLAPNARNLSVSQAIRRVFRLAVLFLVARLLGAEGFGIYALLLTIMEMVAMVSGAGYVDYLTREIAKTPETAWPLALRVTQVRLLYMAPAAAVVLLLLALLRFPLAVVVGAALFFLVLIPRAFGESAQGVLKGLRCFTPFPGMEIAQGTVVLVLGPLLIMRGYGVRGMIAAEVLSATAGAVYAMAAAGPHLKILRSATPAFRDVLRSTFVFNVYPFITNVYDRIDVVLLSKLAGNVATGIYSLPYRAFASLQIIPYGVMGALLPGFSSSQADAAAQQRCARAMKFLYTTALLIVLCTAAFARPLLLLALGPDYAASADTLKVLVWASVPAFLNYALNTLLLAAHHEKVFLWTATICTVFNIVANLIFIPRYSYLAAAVVTVLTEGLLLAQN
ncbi:MAG TPA: oligosaccharide flippase family protein, partial [Candidatus Angelobacter sp.]|nr:oligosaccharide flippase family protein [Candidatus Angelobacter sp.]